MITLAEISRLKTRGSVSLICQRKFDGNEVAFVKALDDSLTELLRTDLKRSRKYLDHSVRVLGLLSHQWDARSLAMRARYALWQGDRKEALKRYRQALSRFEKQKDPLAAARIRRGLIEVLMYLGRYDEALEIGRKSLRYFRVKKMNMESAQVITNLGNVYHRMDRNRDALRMYDKARKLFQRKGGVPLAIVDFNRGNIYANMNDLVKARRLYSAAADIYHKAGLHIAECQAMYSIAYLYYLEDKYTDAIRHLEQAYDQLTKLGDDKTAAVAKLDLIEINAEINQVGLAALMAEEITPVFQGHDMRYELAKTRYFNASARLSLGDYVSATKELQISAKLFSLEGNNLWIGMVALTRARVLLGQGKKVAALKAANDAIKSFRGSGDERRRIDAEITSLEIRLRFGQDSSLRAALRYADSRKLNSAQKYALSNVVGDYWFERDKPEKALPCYRRAIKSVEKMLSGFHNDEVRFFFVANNLHAYTRVVECLLRLGRIGDSFMSSLIVVERINQPIVADKRLQKDVPKHLLDAMNKYRLSLKRLRQHPKDDRRGGIENSQIIGCEQKLWATERKIRLALGGNGSAGSAGSTSAQKWVESLREDEILFQFVETEGGAGIFVASKNRTEYISCDLRMADLQDMVRKLHFAIDRQMFGREDDGVVDGAVRHYLNLIYSSLILPIRSHFLHRKIIFLADGIFSQIPFCALGELEGPTILDEHEVSFIVNPEVLSKRGKSTSKVLESQSALFAVSSDSLPSVELEARQIKQSFRSVSLFQNERATRESLSRELACKSGFVHIATHASRSSENPLFSRILMHDGPFFPFDLYSMGVEAKLVTLSGCQTAAPGLYYGNSFSLAKAFHQAGAEYVLASLWHVSDRFTMLYMTEFYRSLRRNSDIKKAFRDAVYNVKKATDNPVYWAAFVLLGE